MDAKDDGEVVNKGLCLLPVGHGFIFITDITLCSHLKCPVLRKCQGPMLGGGSKGVTCGPVFFFLKNDPAVFLVASGLCGIGPSVWSGLDWGAHNLPFLGFLCKHSFIESLPWIPEPVVISGALPETGAVGSITNPPAAAQAR